MKCYLCGKVVKEEELIPGKYFQVCDLCEAEYECH
jgi:hypothetical protein